MFVIFLRHWSRHVSGGAAFEAEWNAKFAEYEKKYKEEAAELKGIINGELPAGWEKALPVRITFSSLFPFLCLKCYKVIYFMLLSEVEHEHVMAFTLKILTAYFHKFFSPYFTHFHSRNEHKCLCMINVAMDNYI